MSASPFIWRLSLETIIEDQLGTYIRRLCPFSDVSADSKDGLR